MTTKLLDEDAQGDDSGSASDQVGDRSMLDPWLVVILLAVFLIVGAVVRDLLYAKFGKKKDKAKVNDGKKVSKAKRLKKKVDQNPDDDEE